jgi:sulfur-oxidizing protein SoxZ
MAEVKIRLPKTIAKDEVISVRALVAHPMEVISRDKDGKVVDKVYNFIHTVTAVFDGKTVMQGEMTQSLSANPYVEFAFKVTKPGILTITFEDTLGEKHTGTAEIKF